MRLAFLASRNWYFTGKKRRAGWEERNYFYLCFRRLQKAAENRGFSFVLLFFGLIGQGGNFFQYGGVGQGLYGDFLPLVVE